MLPTSICLSLFFPSSLHFGWCGRNEKLQKKYVCKPVWMCNSRTAEDIFKKSIVWELY
jgi:hypothetical protein